MARLARRSLEIAPSRSDTRGRWTVDDGQRTAGHRSGRTSVVLVAALTLLLAVGLGKLAMDTMTASAQDGFGAAPADPCEASGLIPVGDTGLCTHGPDEAPPGTAIGASDVSGAGADPAITCEGNGSTGNRVQVLFGSADGTATSAQLAEIRSSAANANQIYRDSAAQTGGSRSIRFVHNNVTRGCQIDVRQVRLGSSAIAGSFNATITDLRAAGYTSPARKYLVYVEANGLCGIGNLLPDDRRDAANRNNREAGYSRVDNGLGRGFNCWTADVAAHELMHNLGAVQDTAPNTSNAGHCTDEYDVMCYDDDFNPRTAPLRIVCPNANDLTQLDCNHDDYFHTSPPAGSYLQTRWNSAQSRFLIGAVDQPALPAPRNNPFSSPTIATPGRFTETLIVNTATANYSEDPTPSCNDGYNPDQTVWYEVKSAAGGTVTVDTAGSKFRTVVSVHYGSQPNLTETACASDGSGDGASDLRFNAVANRTYYVMVGSYFTGSGNELKVTIVSPGGGGTPAALTLDKISSKFNGVVTATLTGFAPNSSVSLRWSRPFSNDPSLPPTSDLLRNEILKTDAVGRTDANGRVTLTFTTPLEPLGNYTVTARDAAGGQATATLRVIPRIMFQPGPSGSRELRMRVAFYGFGPNDRIEVRWHANTSRSSGATLLTTVTAGSNGRGRSAVIVFPTGSPFGTVGEHLVVGSVVVDGVEVGRSASAVFELTAGGGGASVDDPTPTRTATAEATATPEASPTATPEPVATETPTATAEPVPTETPVPTEVPTVAPTPTETPVPNASPIADAGDDQSVSDGDGAGDEPVTLDGGASTDPEGGPLSYSWSVDGVEVATGVDPTVPLPVGSTTLLLTVTDAEGATGTDEVVIVVAPAEPPAEGEG